MMLLRLKEKLSKKHNFFPIKHKWWKDKLLSKKSLDMCGLLDQPESLLLTLTLMMESDLMNC